MILVIPCRGSTLAITGDNLDFVYLDQFLDISKLHFFKHECPDVVTEPVCLEVSSL